MRPSGTLQSLGLVLAGFLVGIIVANFDRADGHADNKKSAMRAYSVNNGEFRTIAQTDVWEILADSTGAGRRIALSQNGFTRVIVQDDQSALYVMTYKPGDAVWQGRLMDVGNDGTIEVADISYGHCEQFSPAR